MVLLIVIQLIYNSDGIRKAHRTVHTKMVSYVQPLVVAHKFTTRRSRANVNFRVGNGSHLNYHFHKNGAPINANILEVSIMGGVFTMILMMYVADGGRTFNLRVIVSAFSLKMQITFSFHCAWNRRGR